MKQASGLDGLSFDPFSFKQDGLAASEVDVGRSEVGDALVVSQMIVVGDEVADLRLPWSSRISPQYKIDTILQLAHFLAQAAHESDGFKSLHDIEGRSLRRSDMRAARISGNIKRGAQTFVRSHH